MAFFDGSMKGRRMKEGGGTTSGVLRALPTKVRDAIEDGGGKKSPGFCLSQRYLLSKCGVGG